MPNLNNSHLNIFNGEQKVEGESGEQLTYDKYGNPNSFVDFDKDSNRAPAPYEITEQFKELQKKAKAQNKHMICWAIEGSVLSIWNDSLDRHVNAQFLDARSWEYWAPEIKKVIIEDIIQPVSLNSWFENFENCVEFNGLENIDTVDLKSANFMFRNCKKIDFLNLAFLDVYHMTDLVGLCEGCTSLVYVSFGKTVRTVKIKDFNAAFEGCTNLVVADLAGLKFSTHTHIARFFYDCPNLKVVTLSVGNATYDKFACVVSDPSILKVTHQAYE